MRLEPTHLEFALGRHLKRCFWKQQNSVSVPSSERLAQSNSTNSSCTSTWQLSQSTNLPGGGSGNSFPRQRRTVFYGVRVTPAEVGDSFFPELLVHSCYFSMKQCLGETRLGGPTDRRTFIYSYIWLLKEAVNWLNLHSECRAQRN
jgi:hypothetical protein